MLEVEVPSIFIEAISCVPGLRLCFSFFQQRSVHSKRLLRQERIHLFPNFVLVFGRMKFLLNWNSTPYHIPAKGLQAVTDDAIIYSYSAYEEKFTGPRISREGEAPSFI